MCLAILIPSGLWNYWGHKKNGCLIQLVNQVAFYSFMHSLVTKKREKKGSRSLPKWLLMVFGILLPKLFWPTVRKNRSSDREKLLKFEAKGQKFAKIEQFIQTVKGQNNFW